MQYDLSLTQHLSFIRSVQYTFQAIYPWDNDLKLFLEFQEQDHFQLESKISGVIL